MITCGGEETAMKIWGAVKGFTRFVHILERYQRQHQLPFRSNLIDKKCLGGSAYFAEGNFACLFDWDLTHNEVGEI